MLFDVLVNKTKDDCQNIVSSYLNDYGYHHTSLSEIHEPHEQGGGFIIRLPLTHNLCSLKSPLLFQMRLAIYMSYCAKILIN